jgi:hypothetical protein
MIAGRIAGAANERPGSVLAWFVPLGLTIGVLYAALFRAAWRLFGEVDGVRLLPAATIWLLGLLVFDQRGPLGLMCVVDGSTGGRPDEGSSDGLAARRLPLLIATMVLPLLLWMAIPNSASTWPGVWGRWFNFAYPRTVFRPLVLAPLWGAWAWVAAAGVGRVHERADAVARTLCSAGSVRMTLGWLAVPLLLTAVYSGTHGRWTVGCLISLAVFGVTHLYAIISARRVGGHTLDTLASTAWVAQITFLILYLAARHYLYGG